MSHSPKNKTWMHLVKLTYRRWFPTRLRVLIPLKRLNERPDSLWYGDPLSGGSGCLCPLFLLSRHRSRIAVIPGSSTIVRGGQFLSDCSSPARCTDREIASHEKARKIRSG